MRLDRSGSGGEQAVQRFESSRRHQIEVRVEHKQEDEEGEGVPPGTVWSRDTQEG